MAKVRRVEADLAQRRVTIAWDKPSTEGFDCGTNLRTTRITVYRGSTDDVVNTTVCLFLSFRACMSTSLLLIHEMQHETNHRL